jgi:iodotyrosine deiodinase
MARFVPLSFTERPVEEMRVRAERFQRCMTARRTTRQFSTREVPRDLIEMAVRTAGTAPSGAHLQPWTFVAVSDPELKRRMRAAAEAEERQNYEGGRMPPAWRAVLEPLGTSADKPHISDAPWVVVLFKQTVRITESGERLPTYYASESCGIAAGLFIAAIHQMGLVTLTHTPSPMGFLSELLERPDTEKPYLLMPVGYPASGAEVPDLQRKPIEDILVWR